MHVSWKNSSLEMDLSLPFTNLWRFLGINIESSISEYILSWGCHRNGKFPMYFRFVDGIIVPDPFRNAIKR